MSEKKTLECARDWVNERERVTVFCSIFLYD